MILDASNIIISWKKQAESQVYLTYSMFVYENQRSKLFCYTCKNNLQYNNEESFCWSERFLCWRQTIYEK